jgi:hypothetical protein
VCAHCSLTYARNYDNVPKSVETSHEGKVSILWSQKLRTDKTIPNNKPDIIIRDNERGTFKLRDGAVSGVRNVIKKGTKKILKYKYVTL